MPRGLSVLLAEDNPVNTLVATRMLETFGCVVTHAEHGALAVQAAANVPFDVVFMDVQMPVMDGLTATRTIRAQERASGRPAVRIVGLTAGAMLEERREGLAAGMQDYLTKPVQRAALRAALVDAVAQRGERVVGGSHESRPTRGCGDRSGGLGG